MDKSDKLAHDIQNLNIAIRSMAAGVYELLSHLEKDPQDLYFSTHLNSGFNIFLNLGCSYAPEKSAFLQEYRCDEDFFDKLLSRPVSEWFDGWDEDFISRMYADSEFSDLGPLIVPSCMPDYRASDICIVIAMKNPKYPGLEQQERDIFNALSSNVITDEEYAQARVFLIKHKILTEYQDKLILCDRFHNRALKTVILNCYEETLHDTWECPYCGWTASIYNGRVSCSSPNCPAESETPDRIQGYKRIPAGSVRLKKSLMLYFARPGDFELEIADFAESLKDVKVQMYPDRDAYDVKIELPDGRIIAVDAKDYRNLKDLRTAIRINRSLDRQLLTGRADRAFFVAPNQIKPGRKSLKTECGDLLLPGHAEVCTISELKVIIKKELKK